MDEIKLKHLEKQIERCLECEYVMIEEDNVKCMEEGNISGCVMPCPIKEAYEEAYEGYGCEK